MIKIFLEVVNNKLIFAVTDQDDSLRSSIGEIKSFTASNGIEIQSKERVYITSDKIFIQGNYRRYDDDVAARIHDSREDALEMKEKILEAFQEFKENGYFDGKKEEHKNPLNQSYYEF